MYCDASAQKSNLCFIPFFSALTLNNDSFTQEHFEPFVLFHFL